MQESCTSKSHFCINKKAKSKNDSINTRLRGLGRDGHSEQTRFVVERPFRLLKAEKNESKQYI